MTHQSVLWIAWSCALFIGLAMAQIVVPNIAVGMDGAYVDCPCLSNADVATQNYGMGSCKRWDENESAQYLQCREQPPATWCHSRWCFIDSKNCKRAHHPSNLLEDVFFSYTTCGDVDAWVLAKQDAEDTVVVGTPVAGFFVSKSNPTHIHTLRVTLKFAWEALKEMSLYQVLHRNISDESMRASGGSYEACVRDVAIGNLDLCLGDLWRQPEYLAMGTSFIEVYADHVYLVVAASQPPEESLWELLAKPFMPFSWDLWLLLFGTFSVASFLFVMLEHESSSMFDEHHPHESVFLGVYYVWLSFLSGGLSFEPESRGGRMLSVGIAFLIMMACASFTASTATVLITSAAAEPGIVDLSDALSKHLKICLAPFTEVSDYGQYPALQEYGVISTGLDDLLAERCDAALLQEADFMTAQSRGRGCGYVMVARPVITYAGGFYSGESMRSRLAKAVSKLKIDGTWTNIEHDLLPPSACPSDLDQAEEDGFQQLKAKDMLGTCLLLLISGVLAVFVAVCSKLCPSFACQSAAKEDEKEEDVPNSGSCESALETKIQDLSCSIAELRGSLSSMELSERSTQGLPNKADMGPNNQDSFSHMGEPNSSQRQLQFSEIESTDMLSQKLDHVLMQLETLQNGKVRWLQSNGDSHMFFEGRQADNNFGTQIRAPCYSSPRLSEQEFSTRLTRICN